jgi:DNA-binding NarL/FixJ family response regulator
VGTVSRTRLGQVDVRRRRIDPERMAAYPRMPRAGKALTRGEVVVLQLLAEGLTNEQIARKLGRVPGTVSTKVQRILRKLDVPSRAAAVDRGWRRGYLGKDERP